MNFNQGLINLGSTCSINSLIQIICRNTKLRECILNSTNIPEKSFTSELKEILNLMHNENKSLSPNKFINYFYNTFSNIFTRGEQLDINELWYFIIDKISNEISIPYEISNNISNLNDEHNLTIAKYNNFKTSNWLDLIQGSIINIIECKLCNNKTYNFEPFTSIPLDIINNNNPSIIDMLSNYLKIEERTCDDWKCEKCNIKTNYMKTSKLWKTPSVLCFVIKRFNDFNKKNNNNIQTNTNLIFKKGSVFSENDDITFNLSSIGLHHGILQGGHYTSICNINNNYVHYDDNNINILNENDINNIINSNNLGYLIIYEKAN